MATASRSSPRVPAIFAAHAVPHRACSPVALLRRACQVGRTDGPQPSNASWEAIATPRVPGLSSVATRLASSRICPAHRRTASRANGAWGVNGCAGREASSTARMSADRDTMPHAAPQEMVGTRLMGRADRRANSRGQVSSRFGASRAARRRESNCGGEGADDAVLRVSPGMTCLAFRRASVRRRPDFPAHLG